VAQHYSETWLIIIIVQTFLLVIYFKENKIPFQENHLILYSLKQRKRKSIKNKIFI